MISLKRNKQASYKLPLSFPFLVMKQVL
jgi:hypothetical protein